MTSTIGGTAFGSRWRNKSSSALVLPFCETSVYAHGQTRTGRSRIKGTSQRSSRGQRRLSQQREDTPSDPDTRTSHQPTVDDLQRRIAELEELCDEQQDHIDAQESLINQLIPQETVH